MMPGVFRFPSMRAVPSPQRPSPKNHAEVDLNFFFYQVPPSCGFMAEPVGTRQGCSLALHKRAQYARP
jgi:hypothetical protein